MCTSQTSQLISVLFIYLKLEVYLLEKNLWQFLITLSFVSELSRFRAILLYAKQMQSHASIKFKSQISVTVNENKYAHQLQTSLVRYIILKIAWK